MATNKPIILKRFNGTDYDPLFPKTTTTQLFDSLGTTALFDGSDKLKAAYLPSFVFGGMRMAGVVDLSAGTTEANAISLTSLFGSIVNYANFYTTADQAIGTYFVVNAAGFVTKTNGALGSLAYYEFRAFVSEGSPYYSADLGEEGDNTPPVYLERGDWIVLNGKTSPVSGALYYTFSVINNTYALATTTTDGVMSASDKTKLDGIAASANNYVHPAYTTRSVDTTGVEVLDTFTSDAIGSVTGIAKRTLPDATTSAAGVMSAADKTKLDGIATGANLYVLPLATASTLGGIEVGYTSTETNRAVILSGNDAYVNLPRQIPAVTLNGTGTNTPTFYAPTGAGLAPVTLTQSRQFLQAAGNTTAPTWVDHVRINYNDTEAASTSAGVFLGDILFEF